MRESRRDKAKDGFATAKQRAEGSHKTDSKANRWTRPTCAHKLLLLHLGHVVPPQVRRGHALRVKTQPGALSQPLWQPGYVAVTLQVVGVQAAEGQRRRWARQEQVGGRTEIRGVMTGEAGAGWVEGRERELQVRINQSVTQMDTDGKNPSPQGSEVYQIHGDATYKVLSFGMWLKLATDSRLMLLLFRVLKKKVNTQHITDMQKVCPAVFYCYRERGCSVIQCICNVTQKQSKYNSFILMCSKHYLVSF